MNLQKTRESRVREEGCCLLNQQTQDSFENPNKKELSYEFVERMRHKFLKPRFNESKNYVNTVLSSKTVEGIYIYEMPCFALRSSLRVRNYQALEKCRHLLFDLVENGYFLYYFKHGKKKWLTHFNKLLKNGEVWNPWDNTHRYTLTKEILKEFQYIPACFSQWPNTVVPQGFITDYVSADALGVAAGLGAGLLATDYLSIWGAIGAGLLTTAMCGLVITAAQKTSEHVVGPTGTIASKVEAMVKKYTDDILSAIKEKLGGEYLQYAKYIGYVVLAYVIYRLIKSDLLSSSATAIYLSVIHGQDVPEVVDVQAKGGPKGTPLFLALTALALGVGVSAATVYRNYGSCKAIFADIETTFSADNMKELINWLRNICGYPDYYDLTNEWDFLDDLQEFCDLPEIHTKLMQDVDTWDKLVEYAETLATFKPNLDEWSNTDRLRLSSLKKQIQKYMNTYGKSDPRGRYRVRPVSVYMEGAPGKGKSSLAKVLARLIHERCKGDTLQRPQDYMFGMKNSKFPFEGYIPSNHTIVWNDDFLQSTNTQQNAELMEEMMKILEDAPYICNTAFDDKGKVYYRARGHIFTTNRGTDFSTAGVLSMAAFFRRLDLSLIVDLDQDWKKLPMEERWILREPEHKGYIKKFPGKQVLKYYDVAEYILKACNVAETAKDSQEILDFDPFSVFKVTKNPELMSMSLSDSFASDSSSEEELQRAEPKKGMVKQGKGKAPSRVRMPKKKVTSSSSSRSSSSGNIPVATSSSSHAETEEVKVVSQAAKRLATTREYVRDTMIPGVKEYEISFSRFLREEERWQDVLLGDKPHAVKMREEYGIKKEDLTALRKLHLHGNNNDDALDASTRRKIKALIPADDDDPAQVYHTAVLSTGENYYNFPTLDLTSVAGECSQRKNRAGLPLWVISRDLTTDKQIVNMHFWTKIGLCVQLTMTAVMVYAMLRFVWFIIASVFKALSSVFAFFTEKPNPAASIHEERVEEQAYGLYEREGEIHKVRENRLSKARVCDKCKTRNLVKSKHCHHCGTDVTNVEPQGKLTSFSPVEDVDRKVVNNIYKLSVRRGTYISEDHILMANLRQGFVAAHSVANWEDVSEITIHKHGGTSYIFDPSNIKVTLYSGEHTAVLTLRSRTIPNVRDISKHIPSHAYIQEANSVIWRREIRMIDGEPTRINVEGTVVCATYGRSYSSVDGKFEVDHGVLTSITDNYSGLCGAPYFGFNMDKKIYQVMYIHVAKTATGNSLLSCIAVDMLEPLDGTIVENQNFTYKASDALFPQGTTPVGRLTKPLTVANSTDYEESMLRAIKDNEQVDTHFPLQGVPAMTAFWKSMRFKYKQPRPAPEKMLDFISNNINKLIPNFRANINHRCRRLTMEEAVFGNDVLSPIDLTTSTGPTLQYMRIFDRGSLIRKEDRYISPLLVAMVNQLQDKYHDGEWEEFYASLALKDEPLPHKKDVKRVFTIFDLHVLIFMRMELGDLFQEQLLHHNETSCAIGINPHSAEWAVLRERMLRYMNFLMSDFSKLDVTITEWMFMLLGRYVNQIYGYRKGSPPYICLEGIFSAVCAPSLIVGEHVFIGVFNASGWLLTLFTNDFVGQFTHGFIASAIAINNKLPPFVFQDHMYLVSYGDDMLKSFSSYARQYISPEKLALCMNEYFGLFLTGIDKKDAGSWTTDPETLQFIGRGFSSRGGVIMAPLQTSSMQKMVDWVRKSKTVSLHTVYQSIIYSLMYESISHGRAAYEQLEEKLRPIAVEYNFQFNYANYDDAYNQYMDAYRCKPGREIAAQQLFNSRGGLKTQMVDA